MRYLTLALLLGILTGNIAAQTPPRPRLSDYIGTYVDEPGRTLEIVAGDELFAVQNEAKYRLRPSGVDEFVTAIGQKLPSRRDANGKIRGYEESGKFPPRVSLTVTLEFAGFFVARDLAVS